MAKRETESQTTKVRSQSRKLTQFPCMQEMCDTPLESFQRGLQLHFRPYPNRRSAQEVIVLQSRRSSNLANFETPIWESQDKKPFG
jgi:hypothetical protein